MNKKCQQLAQDIIRRTRKIGVSPIAFARYLRRNAQEIERQSPSIAYVDADKERAQRRADHVSELWHVSVAALTLDECKNTLARGRTLRKVLVNHLALDITRRMLRGRKVDIIPIEITYTQQTIHALKKMKTSSILVLLPNHAVSAAPFIVEQLHKWIRFKNAKISWREANDEADFRRLLDDGRYDRILVSPGARSIVPAELHRSSRLLQLEMELVPEALEMARIRAGVIV